MKALIGLVGQVCAEAPAMPKETKAAAQPETIKPTRFIVLVLSSIRASRPAGRSVVML
jgi:hypothetical protein